MPYPKPYFPYVDMNPRQRESFNFQKVSAILADYGYITILLNDDWNGADFIAQEMGSDGFLRVQLKPRLCFDRQYEGHDLHVAFPYRGAWYMYRHDQLSSEVDRVTHFKKSPVWNRDGRFNWPQPPRNVLRILDSWRIHANSPTPPDGDD